MMTTKNIAEDIIPRLIYIASSPIPPEL